MYFQVNIIIIGDHGMTAGVNLSYVELGDYLDPNHVKVVLESGALVTIDPYSANVDEVYHKLKNEMRGVDVYRRNEIPESFHYKESILVLEILVVAKPGYYIRGLRPNPNRSQQYPRDEFYYKQIPLQPLGDNPKFGVHGYADFADMRTIFFAKGPAFKKGVSFPPIHMVDIYQIFANTLNLTPQPNNGTWSKVSQMFLNKGISHSTSILLFNLTCLVQFILVVSEYVGLPSY